VGSVEARLDVLNPGAVQESYSFKALWPWAASEYNTCRDVRANNTVFIRPKVAHGVMVRPLNDEEAIGFLLVDAVYS
jgi:hypothetical protein